MCLRLHQQKQSQRPFTTNSGVTSGSGCRLTAPFIAIREQLTKAISSLPGISSVLDVGCGSGDNLAAFASLGLKTLAGVDVSSAALDEVGVRVPSAKLELLDVQTDRLRQTFDFVCAIQVIEHLLDDIAALRNIAAMSNRYVYVSTMSGRMRRSETSIGHLRNYSPVELAAKAKAAGIDVVAIRQWGFPFYSAYRTVTEFFPGGPPSDASSRLGRIASAALYQLYKLNSHQHGGVITLVGEVRS